MSSDSKMKEIAGFVVDAFDVDIQLFIGKALKNLSKTAAGLQVVSWARANPIAFEILLRLISASVQRIPKNRNLLMYKVVNQLSRLPVEMRRAVSDQKEELPHKTSFLSTADQRENPPDGKQALSDPEFRTRYEEALAAISEEELELVFSLEPDKLQEWVNSPSRIRPLFLRKCADEKERQYEMSAKDKSEDFIKMLDLTMDHEKPLNERIGFVDDAYNDFKKELQGSPHFSNKEKHETISRIDDLLRRYVDKIIDKAASQDTLTYEEQIEELVEGSKGSIASFLEKLSDKEREPFLANLKNLPNMSEEQTKNVQTAILAFATQLQTMIEDDQDFKRKWLRMTDDERNTVVQTAFLNTLRKFNLLDDDV